ncbi:hypothetical protein SAMN05443252_101616 [Bacillus sp. OV322]|uniref:hypothetical protein n=1 Tax=Bacillus sp. OV322 TaxID=1882764 RepID=UPI0008F2F28F|nr:hypothetical protein [Bacillus sp. OV322]SFC04730.1 hypothetical protein SAMN05443252_101616 [Bacillus sp. OV322]
MELEPIWNSFIHYLTKEEGIHKVWYKKIAGLPFLYIQYSEDSLSPDSLSNLIKQASARSMRGKRLHSVTIFVRRETGLSVFRHRFYVPQQKMFCCGNLCDDCILYRNDG